MSSDAMPSEAMSSEPMSSEAMTSDAMTSAGTSADTQTRLRRATPHLAGAALAEIKARLDRDLKTSSPNFPLRLGPALHEAFAREGLFVERVFRTAHPPVVTAIFPTYEDRAVHRDPTLGPADYALSKPRAGRGSAQV